MTRYMQWDYFIQALIELYVTNPLIFLIQQPPLYALLDEELVPLTKEPGTGNYQVCIIISIHMYMCIHTVYYFRSVGHDLIRILSSHKILSSMMTRVLLPSERYNTAGVM